jgi:hypothetical protein
MHAQSVIRRTVPADRQLLLAIVTTLGMKGFED